MKKNTLYLIAAALALYFFTKKNNGMTAAQSAANAVSAQDSLTFSNNQDSINA